MDSRMVLLLLACLTLCSTAPTVAPETDALPEDDETLAENYLSHFYADVGNSAMRRITRPSFNDSLKSMQSFFGLKVTGTLDNETIEVMKAPRCGVPDIGRYTHFHGRPKWQKSIVTYRITNYNRRLSQSQIDATIAKALQLYSDVIPLDFKQIHSGTADMMILFGSGDHGDFDPFDGQSGVLAHATAPGWGVGGDTHFDNDENWTLTERGINLLLVAAHEFGHALGLDHSRDRGALMFPTYSYVRTTGYKLPDDDRRGVQALYGVRTQLVPQPTPPDIGPNPQNDRCNKDLAFDAATSLRGDLFFFKNGYYWRKSTLFQGIRFTKVSTQWPQINYVDAAYEVPNEDVVYLFEGRNYWGISAYANTKLPGYPKPLTKLGLPSNVKKVDAAVFVPTTRKTLFFVNSQYWSYDELRGQMDNGYPRSITRDFPGVSSKVDAAFLNREYLYFCDGARQTEYNLANKRVNRVLLNYYWLNCF